MGKKLFSNVLEWECSQNGKGKFLFLITKFPDLVAFSVNLDKMSSKEI